ncbi:TIGR03013 family XrtA/PEP-CTERM system glycosyltransferase [Desulfosediminicola ganghwensis]|uniref:TIGR03013 family XrtA/PEP-CTERM system glycosyltransferase n=1 Tax=Desulfosediminicola ganghwensis TaxID=2569540 RepID=UPI0010ABA33F
MPYILNRYYSVRNVMFLLGEGLLILFSMMLMCLGFKGYDLFVTDWQLYTGQALLVTVVFLLCLYFFDLYELSKHQSMPDTATRLAQAFGVGCIILAGVYYAIPFLTITTLIFWSGFVATGAVLLSYRALYYYVLRKRLFHNGVVIVGTGKLADDISREIEHKHDSEYKVLAFIGQDEPQFNPYKVPLIASLEDLQKAYPGLTIRRIVVAPDERRGTMPVRTLLAWKLRGVAVEQGVTFYERITGKVLAERIDPSWIIFADGFVLSVWKYFTKRLIDILMAAGLLVIFFPVMLISSIIIKWESEGPVFYLQERVGQNGKLFQVIKFRSMCQDAEKDGAVWAKENDDRVTTFGRFIRKARIDELPQLINVLKGEMSLVGPRPERKVFIDDLAEEIPYYSVRHVVKPGITGWAQVCYPYGASKEDALRKLEYDLYYIKNISIALDFLVIFHTVKTVLFGRGGR